LNARRDVVRAIRQFRPDIVVTSDPNHLFGDNWINHPDHRAAGQIVVDAVYPAAGNPLFFPELLALESLAPHAVKEVWLTVTGQPNVTIDVTDTWEMKIDALHCHSTQIVDMGQLDERMRGRRTSESSEDARA
jgi:LmbE family N-acetylglucosaminyl deacetylase